MDLKKLSNKRFEKRYGVTEMYYKTMLKVSIIIVITEFSVSYKGDMLKSIVTNYFV